MNISYNWLKEYVNFDLTPDEVAAALTSIGLETGGVEEVQTIKGGLEGIVIGEVLTCEPHPNSDHMHVTTVNLGQGEPVQIVCGAPNVAAGQKVVVATLGTKLYDGEECFTIKKSKLRGIESIGMICAEDEIGIGTGHDGIIVLPDDAVPGTPAKDYYNIKSDYVLEVDITPNRADACSHYGVARDLYAYLIQNGRQATLTRPSVEGFKVDNHDMDITVEVENTEACPRYAGVSIKGVTVKESPDWLQNKLRLIGLRPINNIVDITNYILHAYGQPLHCFDADKIKGGKIVVKTVAEGTKFTTLDEVERTLSDRDLMICNTEEPMCIAGVFGGLDSGTTEQTGVYHDKLLQAAKENYLASGAKGNFEDFVSVGYERFLIDPVLKQKIVFTQHDLVTDQVFGEMQMVICRNVMIYFRRELQTKVLTLFHDSLDLGGFLGLGIKESLSSFPNKNRFRVIDESAKVFQRVD